MASCSLIFACNIKMVGPVARRGCRRSGAVHGGVAPTGRVEEARARHTKEVARGTRDRRGAGRTDIASSSTAMEESKVEMANRVARFQVD